MWVLDAGIVVVWFPAVLLLIREKGTGMGFSPKRVIESAPLPVVVVFRLLLIYAVFSFFYTTFVLAEGGDPSIINGQKVLSSHGHIIRSLMDEEYERQEAYHVRSWSSLWMIFYSGSLAVMYLRLRKQKELPVEGREKEERGRRDIRLR
jgi:hypothetical protein